MGCVCCHGGSPPCRLAFNGDRVHGQCIPSDRAKQWLTIECAGAALQLGQRFSGGGKDQPEYARANYLLRTLGMQAGPLHTPCCKSGLAQLVCRRPRYILCSYYASLSRTTCSWEWCCSASLLKCAHDCGSCHLLWHTMREWSCCLLWLSSCVLIMVTPACCPLTFLSHHGCRAQKYEGCLRRGKLTDNTIMLWNDSCAPVCIAAPPHVCVPVLL